MATYMEPLKIYFLGSSFRWLGEPDDLVQGFFASRLERPAFLEEWQSSGRRLRHWLITGFKHHLLEETRRRARLKREQALPEEPAAAPAAADANAERAFDRAVAASTVRQARAAAEAKCDASGQSLHWRIFVAHVEHERPFALIAREEGLTEVKAKVMARTASNKFRAALLEMLGCDADSEAAGAEVAELMESLRS
jgi:hypothetical protein